MPRTRFALTLALTLAAAPAVAQIGIQGSVLPASPTLQFGTPAIAPIPGNFFLGGAFDTNSDGYLDWLTNAGNGRAGIFTAFTDPSDPTGALGLGVRWNDVTVWAGYETPQNILVGDTGQTGTLTIAGGGELRYQYLVLGGVADNDNNGAGVNTSLDVSVGEDPNDFLLTTHLAAAEPGQGGFGTLIVSGAGSLFNNDPNILPTDLQAALNVATGNPINELVTDIADRVAAASGGVALTPREFGTAGFGFDVIVGLNGGGRLEVTNGGRVEVQDALMVAVDQLSTGDVLVDGAGSSLIAFGREEFDNNGDVTESTTAATSFVGGAGRGTLTVSTGGRAEFRNGLSIGRAIGTDLVSLDAFDEGSGEVLVTGRGSQLKANASAITGMTFNIDTVDTVLALAIGEQALTATRDLTTPIPAADSDLQPGKLTVADGASVTTGFDAQYGTTADDTNIAIGKTGELELRDGTVTAGNRVLHDGLISGYGTLRGRSFETSVHAVTRGGDADANLAGSAAPLRIILNGAVNGPTDLPLTAFTNRGLVEGLVDIETSGVINNFGRIDSDGEIEAALGLVNGTRQSLVSSGATISATGRIQSATFVNERFGEVTVGAGESLSILADATASITVAGIREDGTSPAVAAAGDGNLDVNDAPLYQANLGSIRVSGGSLEVGRSTGPATQPTNPLGVAHVDLFRNARIVTVDATSTSLNNVGDEAIGTITADSGELTFRNGLYNTGVVAFTGGSNVVSGRVINAGGIPRLADNGDDGMPATGDERLDRRGIDYDVRTPQEYLRSGVIVVSGDGTTVTFEDNVVNSGIISIGPFDAVANFLGDLELSGELQIAVQGGGSGSVSRGAAIVVNGAVNIQGGDLMLGPFFAMGAASFEVGYSVELLSAGSLSEDSLFTGLELPQLADGLFWDVIYDTANGEVRLEVIQSSALGADFTGDGLVTGADVDVWIRNAGILTGASTIQGDADLDGDVDLRDYSVLQQQLLAGVPSLVGVALASAVSASVPEPAALAMVLLSAAAVSRRR